MELYDASNKCSGFEYPHGLGKIVELGIVDMDTWFIMDAPFAEGCCADMASRYPERKLVPFAKRCDNDDVACFEIGKPGKVEVIHDFAEPGWEQRREYDDFWGWFEDAVRQLVESAREEERDGR